MKAHWPGLIKTLREATGWSTRDLAAKVGVSHRTVEDWEQGRRTPSGSAQIILRALVDDDALA